MSRFTSPLAEIAPPLDTRFWDQDIYGCEAVLVLKAALECSLFDILEEAPHTAAEIAAVLGGGLKKTAAFLDALTALAYLEKRGESYRLSPAAEIFLRCDSVHNIRDLLQSRFSRFQELQQISRRLREPDEGEEGRGWDAAKAVRFTRIMAQSAVSSGSIRSAARRIARDPAFRRARRMLDLGCSHGLYTASLCLLNHDLQAVLFDRPEVLQLTQRYLERYRLGGRVEYRGGDFNTDPLGDGYDLVFASHVFYRSPEIFIPVLQKICQSLKPGGLLYLQHRYLNLDRSSPAPAVLYYCTRVLLSPSFYVATLPEAVAGLQRAGFTVTSIRRSRRSGNTLLRARR